MLWEGEDKWGCDHDPPCEPCVHGDSRLGASSYWWYSGAMYSPVHHCGRCTRAPAGEDSGAFLSRMLRRAAAVTSGSGGQALVAGVPVKRTAELYRVPRWRDAGHPWVSWSDMCITWPAYANGSFQLYASQGVSMLELDESERDALRIVLLRTSVAKETFAGVKHFANWKKTGLSRAYFAKERVCVDLMPTDRAKAAYVFLVDNNVFYKSFGEEQAERLRKGASLNVSSYDLFINTPGIECAMFPWLYPTSDFTDTGIREHYEARTDDESNRVYSIGFSYTRKVLSSVRVYGEQRDLPFFLYERQNAHRFFWAHQRAKNMGVTGDVMARDSQTSAGYWEIVQDSLADLVRIMEARCMDAEGQPLLYAKCRGLRSQLWMCAFPNLFITIAPAEWKFPRPYFLAAYLSLLYAGAYVMALHMFYVVRSVWSYLVRPGGHRYFRVYEWVMKTEYQGLGTPHWHIAAWVVVPGLLSDLEGRTGTKVVSAFVKFLFGMFQCEIDVQVGNGRINYINGYVSKDHDAVDVGLGEYAQKNATTAWLATYRLLSKGTPCIPEVAVRMARLQEWEKSYVYALLYPPQPVDMVTLEGRQKNFSARVYGVYQQEQRSVWLRVVLCRRVF